MNNLLFISASLLGAFAISWMGYDFAGANTLAFAVTASIGGVYLIGIIELLRFHRATASLSVALDSITPQVTAAPDWLEAWLKRLDPAVRGGVRLRIVGERTGLPTPVFTPYLVGLLVMLGLLGTFVGMVDTLSGAVSALQGSTELDAIRASLTAPIRGLGVAFGTSVAGVAASAMLGLISTMVRHERIQATRQLDAKIVTEFKEFSLGHQRQQAFSALQSQAGALPAVASDLQAVAAQLATMSDTLSETLLANQNQFHAQTEQRFNALATAVDQSLRESLAASGKAAGDSMQPVMTSAVADISNMLKETQQQQALAAREQLQTLGDEFGAAGTSLLNTFATTSSSWAEQTLALQDNIKQTLTESARDLSNNARTSATNLLTEFATTSTAWIEQTLALQNSLKQTLTESARDLSDNARTNATSLLTEFATTSTSWTEQTLALQDSIKQTLTESARDLSDSARTSATSMLTEIGGLLQSTEALVEARTASEAIWLDRQGERLEQLTTTLTAQLETLRAQEEQGQAAALARLAELESTVASHLTQLGQGLEAPMTRLIETASERLEPQRRSSVYCAPR
jgi:hypothetical protein